MIMKALNSWAAAAALLLSVAARAQKLPTSSGGAALNSCNFSAGYFGLAPNQIPADFSAALPVYRNDAWRVYTLPNGGDSKQPNRSIICVLSDFGILADGLLAAEDIEIEDSGKYLLVVRTAEVKANGNGLRYITPELLRFGVLWVEGGRRDRWEGQQLIYGRSGQGRELDGGTEYYLPVDRLESLLRSRPNKTAAAREVAWVSRPRWPKPGESDQTFTVYWRPNEDPMSAIKDAVRRFAKGDQVCGKGARFPDPLNPELEAYLNRLLADPGLTQYSADYAQRAGKDSSAAPPSVTFDCDASLIGQGRGLTVVKPNWVADDRKSLQLVAAGSAAASLRSPPR